jgi:hypothetical protein
MLWPVTMGRPNPERFARHDTERFGGTIRGSSLGWGGHWKHEHLHEHEQNRPHGSPPQILIGYALRRW